MTKYPELFRDRYGTSLQADAVHQARIEAGDLAYVFERAVSVWEPEEALAAEITAGTAPGDAFELESWLAQRAKDPTAKFGEHLARLNRAI